MSALREVAEALGEAWPGGPVHAGMDFAANTHILVHAGRLLATVEAGPLPYRLTDELDTVGPCDFDGTLPGGYAAHAKLDRAPATCTRSPTSGAGSTSSTWSSAPTAGPATPPTSRSPTVR